MPNPLDPNTIDLRDMPVFFEEIGQSKPDEAELSRVTEPKRIDGLSPNHPEGSTASSPKKTESKPWRHYFAVSVLPVAVFMATGVALAQSNLMPRRNQPVVRQAAEAPKIIDQSQITTPQIQEETAVAWISAEPALRVHSEPVLTPANSVGAAQIGAQVEVIRSVDPYWAYVRYGKVEGYVARAHLSRVPLNAERVKKHPKPEPPPSPVEPIPVVPIDVPAVATPIVEVIEPPVVLADEQPTVPDVTPPDDNPIPDDVDLPPVIDVETPDPNQPPQTVSPGSVVGVVSSLGEGSASG